MTEGVSVAEAEIIARDAAKAALREHAETIPKLMKPVMYEVAETVSARATSDMHRLFNHVFGADVTNEQHLRDLHKDLYFLRDQRVSYEQRRAIARQEVVRSVVRSITQALAAAIIAVLMLFGLNLNLPKG